NAVVLRGSSSAIHSNKALVRSIYRALENSKLPVGAVQLIEDTSRETAKQLFRLNDYLDVLIPSGGERLIETVIQEATVPVIETGAGNCHAFIDRSAQKEMTEKIILNAKLQRPSVCNAVESLLIERNWFKAYGADLLTKLAERNVEIFAEEEIMEQFGKAKLATEADWGTEYLRLAISVKLVDDVEEAI